MTTKRHEYEASRSYTNTHGVIDAAYFRMLFPTTQSDQLDIKIVSPLPHGGHSFAFKVSTNKGNSVLKILEFRFPSETRRDAPTSEIPEPYLYFNREVEAYARLIERDAAFCPRIISTVIISAADEHTLRSHMKAHWASLYRRRVKATKEELPLKALLMEWIDGNRLTGPDLLRESVLQVELLKAIGKMHSCGVIWGDVKWRNIIVQSSTIEGTAQLGSSSNGVSNEVQAKRLILLDYSNAYCQPPLKYGREEGQRSAVSEEEWKIIGRNEYEVVRFMIKSGKLPNSSANNVTLNAKEATAGNRANQDFRLRC